MSEVIRYSLDLSSGHPNNQRAFLEWKSRINPLIALLLKHEASPELVNQVLGFIASYGCSSSPKTTDLNRYLRGCGVEDLKADSMSNCMTEFLPPDIGGSIAAEFD